MEAAGLRAGPSLAAGGAARALGKGRVCLPSRPRGRAPTSGRACRRAAWGPVDDGGAHPGRAPPLGPPGGWLATGRRRRTRGGGVTARTGGHPRFVVWLWRPLRSWVRRRRRADLPMPRRAGGGRRAHADRAGGGGGGGAAGRGGGGVAAAARAGARPPRGRAGQPRRRRGGRRGRGAGRPRRRGRGAPVAASGAAPSPPVSFCWFSIYFFFFFTCLATTAAPPR